MKKLILTALFGILFTDFLLAQSRHSYPVTRKAETSDNYFGTIVADPYRWLEDDRSIETAKWVKEQNAFTYEYLGGIPFRDKIRARLTETWNYTRETAPFYKGAQFFFFRNNGLQNQSVLFVKNTLESPATELLDFNTLSKDGTVSLNGLSISRDGAVMAFGVSTAGSDWIEIRFMDLKSRQMLLDVLKWVKFSGMSWQGKSFYYSRFSEPDGSKLSVRNAHHKVYCHKLGTPQSEDVLLYEDQKNGDYNFGATVTDDERFVFLNASKSTSGEMLRFKALNSADTAWKVISSGFDFDYSLVGNDGNVFYVLTNHQAPRYKLVAIEANSPEEKNWRVIIPEGKDLLEGVHQYDNSFLVNYLSDVRTRLFIFSKDGKTQREIPLPGLCRVNAIHAEKNLKQATFSLVKFTAPESIYAIETGNDVPKLLFKPDCKFVSEKYETKQVWFKSKDGTKVPMFITYRKDLVLNAQTPCFVYGYGGFNISLAPEFRIDRTVFLEAGGIYAVPGLRGGGEFGEDWHKAGTRCLKQNVFDDFISACEFLVSNKYTSFDKIAIHGRSNGGLLAAAVLTQRPDICKVAVPTVGVLDMLRFHLFTIGRAWTVDYGCSENKDEFSCLYKYSPLHQVKAVKYPATLVLTGDHDDRVVPAHSFKFAATLQEKTTGAAPCLIRIDENAGHGMGKPTSKQIDEFTDMWSFVMQHLDMHL